MCIGIKMGWNPINMQLGHLLTLTFKHGSWYCCGHQLLVLTGGLFMYFDL